MRILFVCDGNICRSPMAEALLRQTLSERRLNWVNVTSGGLVASPTGVAHSQLRRVLGPAYVLVENRRSQPLTEPLMAESDLILGMEDRHVRQLTERFPASKGRIDKITTYAGKNGEVRDFPESGYGTVVEWLRHCYNIMQPCIVTIADRLALERKND